MAGERLGSSHAALERRSFWTRAALVRAAPTLLVVALLIATGIAFIVTERQKLEPSPLGATKVDRLLAPMCRCPRHAAIVRFRLRPADAVTIDVVDRRGRSVRRLVRDRAFAARQLVVIRWDGRDDSGRLVADGAYRPRIRLEGLDRTFILPNRIRVDTVTPRTRVLRRGPRVISPNGDGRADRFSISYRVSEPASVVLLVNGNVRGRVRGERTAGRVSWYARSGGKGLPPGRYRLQLVARDLAGNLGPRTRVFVVRIRYGGRRG